MPFHSPNFSSPWDDPALESVLEAARSRNVIKGTNGNDKLVGTPGDDLLLPKHGIDSVDGKGGNDALHLDYSGARTSDEPFPQTINFATALSGTLNSSLGSTCDFSNIERIEFLGSDNDDRLALNAVSNSSPSSMHIDIDGGGGTNELILQFSLSSQALTLDVLADGSMESNLGTLRHFAGSLFYLGTANDHVSLGAFASSVWGGGGDDVLSGSDGGDFLTGGAGTDILTGGGGADQFGYDHSSDSKPKAFDTIMDFSHAQGDQIILRFDADHTQRGSQDFTFIGGAPFDAPGEIRSVDNHDGTYTVQVNVDADDQADFQLLVHADQPLVASDFVPIAQAAPVAPHLALHAAAPLLALADHIALA